MLDINISEPEMKDCKLSDNNDDNMQSIYHRLMRLWLAPGGGYTVMTRHRRILGY